MSSEPNPTLQQEVNQKIAHALFQETVGAPPPLPATWPERIAWVGQFGASWFLLILAISNLALAFFDYSYLDLRHMYLQVAPGLVSLYDPVKGISPHRSTEAYVAHAEASLASLRSGAPAPVTNALLADMQERSSNLIQEDPFAGAGLSGIFEHAKNLMRRHTRIESAKKAFSAFWSAGNLTPYRLADETRFFESKMRPLIARNFYRRIGENGRPFDAFWLIDLVFLPFFILEFILRGLHATKRGQSPSWKAFAFSRWYDVSYLAPIGLSLVPFGQSGWIHLLRTISVSNRMSRLGLFNPIAFTQSYTNRIVALMTDLVTVRLIGNYQDSIRQFDLTKAIHMVSPEQRDLLRRVVEQHVEGVIVRVMPAMATDLNNLVTYSAQQALHASPAYQQIRQLPVIGSLPDRYLPALVAEVVSGTQEALGNALRDPDYRELVDRTIEKATNLLLEELSQLKTEQELKHFLIDLLEQQKLQLLA